MKRSKILIADDEVSITEILKEVLAEENYEIIITHTGPDTLKQAEMHQPDLIILDMMLPGIDGFDVSYYLSLRSGKARPKIIALTARDMSWDENFAKASGVDVYIRKPFDINELKKKIKELLLQE
jgi:DNA-binding response OmpR family regulator